MSKHTIANARLRGLTGCLKSRSLISCETKYRVRQGSKSVTSLSTGELLSEKLHVTPLRFCYNVSKRYGTIHTSPVVRPPPPIEIDMSTWYKYRALWKGFTSLGHNVRGVRILRDARIPNTRFAFTENSLACGTWHTSTWHTSKTRTSVRVILKVRLNSDVSLKSLGDGGNRRNQITSKFAAIERTIASDA
jgi:hypothetical protein